MKLEDEAVRSAERAVYVISVAAELAGMHPQTLRITSARSPRPGAPMEAAGATASATSWSCQSSTSPCGGLTRGREAGDGAGGELGRVQAEWRPRGPEARLLIDQVHRQYRRDLVPLKQSPACVRPTVLIDYRVPVVRFREPGGLPLLRLVRRCDRRAVVPVVRRRDRRGPPLLRPVRHRSTSPSPRGLGGAEARHRACSPTSSGSRHWPSRTDPEVVARTVDTAFRRLADVGRRSRRHRRQVHGRLADGGLRRPRRARRRRRAGRGGRVAHAAARRGPRRSPSA